MVSLSKRHDETEIRDLNFSVTGKKAVSKQNFGRPFFFCFTTSLLQVKYFHHTIFGLP